MTTRQPQRRNVIGTKYRFKAKHNEKLYNSITMQELYRLRLTNLSLGWRWIARNYTAVGYEYSSDREVSSTPAETLTYELITFYTIKVFAEEKKWSRIAWSWLKYLKSRELSTLRDIIPNITIAENRCHYFLSTRHCRLSDNLPPPPTCSAHALASIP